MAIAAQVAIAQVVGKDHHKVRRKGASMSLVLNLPQELESELTIEAQRLGLSLADYVLRLLSEAREVRPPIKTGADLVQYWESEGLVGTRPDISDSQAHARRLREQAERRSRP
jgi:hypothetical protein